VLIPKTENRSASRDGQCADIATIGAEARAHVQRFAPATLVQRKIGAAGVLSGLRPGGGGVAHEEAHR
jgi:hypothetical protein